MTSALVAYPALTSETESFVKLVSFLRGMSRSPNCWYRSWSRSETDTNTKIYIMQMFVNIHRALKEEYLVYGHLIGGKYFSVRLEKERPFQSRGKVLPFKNQSFFVYGSVYIGLFLYKTSFKVIGITDISKMCIIGTPGIFYNCCPLENFGQLAKYSSQVNYFL